LKEHDMFGAGNAYDKQAGTAPNIVAADLAGSHLSAVPPVRET
jgi:hypothetical protein